MLAKAQTDLTKSARETNRREEPHRRNLALTYFAGVQAGRLGWGWGWAREGSGTTRAKVQRDKEGGGQSPILPSFASCIDTVIVLHVHVLHSTVSFLFRLLRVGATGLCSRPLELAKAHFAQSSSSSRKKGDHLAVCLSVCARLGEEDEFRVVVGYQLRSLACPCTGIKGGLEAVKFEGRLG